MEPSSDAKLYDPRAVLLRIRNQGRNDTLVQSASEQNHVAYSTPKREATQQTERRGVGSRGLQMPLKGEPMSAASNSNPGMRTNIRPHHTAEPPEEEGRRNAALEEENRRLVELNARLRKENEALKSEKELWADNLRKMQERHEEEVSQLKEEICRIEEKHQKLAELQQKLSAPEPPKKERNRNCNRKPETVDLPFQVRLTLTVGRSLLLESPPTLSAISRRGSATLTSWFAFTISYRYVTANTQSRRSKASVLHASKRLSGCGEYKELPLLPRPRVRIDFSERLRELQQQNDYPFWIS